MKAGSLNLLQELDSISKIHTLKRDDIDTMMIEFAKRILVVYRLERLNVWLFNQQKDALVSIGEYDARTQSFTKGNKLFRSDFPNYFNAISENEIILVEDANSNAITQELSETYSKPNDVKSLMDIPLRICGDLIGVMCFEKTGAKKRNFTEEEQSFALSLSIVFATNLEARHRRELQHKLDKELHEKTILLKEIHHRVKNNLSVVASLINLQAAKAKDDYHRGLFNECNNKINSISSIHDIIYRSKSLSEINANEYLSTLLNNLKRFYDSRSIDLEFYVEDLLLDLEYALPLALIVNEVVTNSYKHAFNNKTTGKIKVALTSEGDFITLQIKDDGLGFVNTNEAGNTLGFDIINGLTEQISGNASFESNNGTQFVLKFRAK